VRVCRAWADIGLPLLWRDLKAYALTHVSDPQRRQQCANWVRALNIDHDSYFERLRDLTFPRLRAVRLHNDDDGNVPTPDSAPPADAAQHDNFCASCFFHPTLEVIQCNFEHLNTDPIQHRLAAVCPRLRHLGILPEADAAGWIRSEQFNCILAILRRLPSLESVDPTVARALGLGRLASQFHCGVQYSEVAASRMAKTSSRSVCQRAAGAPRCGDA
jgi:hypothetical protein